MPSYNRYYQGFLVFGFVVNPGHFQTVYPVKLSPFPFQGTCAKSEALRMDFHGNNVNRRFIQSRKNEERKF